MSYKELLLRSFTRLEVFCKIKVPRYLDGMKTVRGLLSNPGFSDIGREDKRNIKKKWGCLNYHIYKPYFRYYKRFADGKPIENYIPNIFMWNHVEPFFYDCLKARYYDDKNLYDMYFGTGALMPKTIVHVINGFIQDSNYRIISEEQAVDLCLKSGRIVVKPSMSTCGGKGIVFWSIEADDKASLNKYLSNNNVLIQERVVQHEALSCFHPSSVNTIRIITFANEGKISVLSSVLRMGAGGSHVDNVSSGGVFCGVSDDGALYPFAYDRSGNKFDRHPTTGTVFEGRSVPYFEKCKRMVCENASKFCNVSKIISWDISITPEGEPMLIEFNLTYGGITSHQITRGPLFGDHTDELLSLVR